MREKGISNFSPPCYLCNKVQTKFSLSFSLSSEKDSTTCTKPFQALPWCPCLRFLVSVQGRFLPLENGCWCSLCVPWKGRLEVHDLVTRLGAILTFPVAPVCEHTAVLISQLLS